MHSVFEIVEDTDSDSDDVGPELISLADVKLELGITSSSEDEWLDANITRWSRIIADYCDRVFARSSARETFYFDSREFSRLGAGLPLKLYPIGVVDSVLVDGTEVAVVFDERGIIWREDKGGWTGTVVVEYSGGYDLPDGAPAALQLAVIEAIRGRRASAASSSGGAALPTGVRSITHGDTSITFSQDATSTSSSSSSTITAGLPLTVAELVRPFRRFTV